MDFNRILTLTLLTLAFSLLSIVQANVEKTIFVAPQPPTFRLSPTQSTVHPSLDDIGLDSLSPLNPLLRTRLNASFPASNNLDDSGSEGSESWFLLEGLDPGRRYEVRVCWLATQPTSFNLKTYRLESITTNDSLLPAISRFSSARLASIDYNAASPTPKSRTKIQTQKDASAQSLLLLRITAAADYFSLNVTLMTHVPSVATDIILDPFLLNIFPKSLLPTAGWMVLVIVVAVMLARTVKGEVGKAVLEDVREEFGTARSVEKKAQ